MDKCLVSFFDSRCSNRLIVVAVVVVAAAAAAKQTRTCQSYGASLAMWDHSVTCHSIPEYATL